MSFTIFDGLLYTGKPSSASLGLTPIAGIGEGFGSTPTGTLPSSGQTGAIYFDWEPTIANPTDAANFNTHAVSLLSSARGVAPGATYGFYNTPILGPGPSIEPTWDSQLSGLMAAVDYVFPDMYTFDTTPGHVATVWIPFNNSFLAEARSIAPSKPVCAFLQPQYFGSSSYIYTPDWILELQWVLANCDGVVLWGGFGQTWDPTAAWWRAVQSVLLMPGKASTRLAVTINPALLPQAAVGGTSFLAPTPTTSVLPVATGQTSIAAAGKAITVIGMKNNLSVLR